MKTKFLALLMALVMLLTFLAGCGKKDDEDADASASPSESLAPSDNDAVESASPDDGDGSETDDGNENMEKKTVTITIEGMEELVELSKTDNSFEQRGGPSISMYIDLEHVVVAGVESAFRVESIFDPDNTFIEVDYNDGRDAEDVAPGLLDSYEYITDLSDEGDVSFAGEMARHVYGTSEEHVWSAYIIDVFGGCITVVICTPAGEGGPDMAVRLFAMSETIKIY